MSRSRKKSKPQPERQQVGLPEESGNAPWFVPTFVSLLVVGLVWVVTTYISQSTYPIPALGAWNLAVGFVLILAGFLMTMRWK
ncbi:cell division protein CrgA [Serinibacter salmoneus]|uniref:cell division protein CrgA n=1 Tax=Serinibacter salmoneus TaxID=556530 RepID=UPI003CCC0A1D